MIHLQTRYGSSILADLKYMEIDVKHNVITLGEPFKSLHQFAGSVFDPLTESAITIFRFLVTDLEAETFQIALKGVFEEIRADGFQFELQDMIEINSDFSAAQFKAISDLAKELYGEESGNTVFARILRGL